MLNLRIDSAEKAQNGIEKDWEDLNIEYEKIHALLVIRRGELLSW